MSGVRAPYGYVSRFVESVQASGRLLFSENEAREGTGVDGTALREALRRNSATGAIRRLSRKSELFLIVPPEYRTMGAPPPDAWLDRAMQRIGQPYRIGMLSAAERLGSAHFAVMELQVMTTKWMPPLEVGRQRVRFVQEAPWSDAPVKVTNGFWGKIVVSAPETCILEILRHRTYGAARVVMLLSDLMAEFEPVRFERALAAMNDVPAAQRLGFLLRTMGNDDLADIVKKWIGTGQPRVIALDAREGAGYAVDREWNVRINDGWDDEIQERSPWPNLAEKNGVKVAWLVRRAVERLIEQAEGGPLLPLDL